MRRAPMVVAVILFLGGVAFAAAEGADDAAPSRIRTAEEGNPFAQLGIDCGKNSEAGATDYFGLGPAYETTEEAVIAEVGRMSDLDPAAADNGPELATESTGESGVQRTYFVAEGGVPVAVVKVLQKDQKWHVLSAANCVAKQ